MFGWLKSSRVLRGTIARFESCRDEGRGAKSLRRELDRSRFPLRLMRYSLAGSALAEEARRLGRPLEVVDLGCEKGWLKQMTPPEAVAGWTGLDWNPRQKELQEAGYDAIIAANFDQTLPLADGSVDAVVSLHVFEHLPRPGFTAAEVSRILRPGGVFFAGAPTMPSLFARLREKWFRSRLKAGKITPGGHINSLSPARWKRLTYDVGLGTEFVTGSHLVRFSGNGLENRRWWIRLNQLWGACFPALGSECFILARRSEPWAEQPQRLRTRALRVSRQLRWVAAGSTALIAAALIAGGSARMAFGGDDALETWVNVQQDGNNLYFVYPRWMTDDLAGRGDVRPLNSMDDIVSSAGLDVDPHLLLSAETAQKWARVLEREQFHVASHLSLPDQDYYLFGRTPPRRIQDFLNIN